MDTLNPLDSRALTRASMIFNARGRYSLLTEMLSPASRHGSCPSLPSLGLVGRSLIACVFSMSGCGDVRRLRTSMRFSVAPRKLSVLLLVCIVLSRRRREGNQLRSERFQRSHFEAKVARVACLSSASSVHIAKNSLGAAEGY